MPSAHCPQRCVRLIPYDVQQADPIRLSPSRGGGGRSLEVLICHLVEVDGFGLTLQPVLPSSVQPGHRRSTSIVPLAAMDNVVTVRVPSVVQSLIM